MGTYSWGLALCALLLFVGAGALFYGYLTPAVVGGLDYIDFTVFGVFALLAAAAFYEHEGSRRYRRGFG
jgi:hypothetical protein